jgi:hypothetical protein
MSISIPSLIFQDSSSDSSSSSGRPSPGPSGLLAAAASGGAEDFDQAAEGAAFNPFDDSGSYVGLPTSTPFMNRTFSVSGKRLNFQRIEAPGRVGTPADILYSSSYWRKKLPRHVLMYVYMSWGDTMWYVQHSSTYGSTYVRGWLPRRDASVLQTFDDIVMADMAVSM